MRTEIWNLNCYRLSELHCVQVLVDDDAVNSVDVELDVLLCLQGNLYKLAVAVDCTLVALVDEGWVNGCVAVAVQTVLAVVCHVCSVQCLDAYVLILRSVVWQCKAECVHICKAVAADGDYNLFACMVSVLVGCDGDAACYLIASLLIYAVADACCCNR